MNRRARRRQRGQGLIEFIITVAVLGPLLLGIFQAILLYRAKTVLDYAALQAARSGSTHFAETGPMCQGLAKGLMPLYAHDASVAGVAAAYATADADICLGKAGTIRVVSPTRAAFDDWKEPQYDGVEAIPNDSLAYRGDRVGAGSGMTVQDANVLKISVTYRYPLIVPLIDRFIGRFDAVRSAAEGHTVYSLQMTAQAIVRMQTPIRDRGLLSDGSAGGGSSDGSGGGSGTGSGDGGSVGGGDGSGGSGGGGDGSPGHVCV
jgi:hypothetical protein